MANLPETEDFSEGTYQIETSDRVLGGPGGIANKQAVQLGNRTAWLRAKIAALVDGTLIAAKAAKLGAARTLSISGAGTGNVSFDGSNNADIALTLNDSGVDAGTYPVVSVNVKGLVVGGRSLAATDIPGLPWSKISSGRPTTLAGYGIGDAITVGQFGLGSSTAFALPIDTIGLGGGFYYYGAGSTGFGNNVSLVNIPYGIAGYAGQIGFQQGNPEPKLLVRACKAVDTWGPTREVFHTGNFDPSAKAPLVSPVFTGQPEVPTPAAGANNKLAANTEFVKKAVDTALTALVDGAPGALDNFRELAAAMGNDPNFATTVLTALNGKAAKATTLAGYGITDAITVGQFGLGGSTASSVPIDTVGLSGGFYYYGAGTTGFGNNVGLVNIPYGIAGYSGQLGFRQGQVEPEILVRGCASKDTWGNTRFLWHSGNFDPNSITPAGTTVAFAGTTAPTGFLKENGAAYSRTAYARLFSVIGTTYGAGDGSTTFNVPDSRGEFIRGADDGRGVNPNRAVGSWEDSQNKAHTHSYGAQHNTNYGLSATGYAGVSPGGQVMYETASSGAAESRPRNTARLFCIKY